MSASRWLLGLLFCFTERNIPGAGKLSAAEATRVKKELESSSSLRQRLEELQLVHSFLNTQGQSLLTPSNAFTDHVVCSFSTGSKEPIADENEIDIYPNPASDLITVKWNDNFRCIEINLTDIQGRKVFSKQISNLTTEYPIDIHNLPAGIYLAECISDDGSHYIKKVIKQAN